MKKTVKVSDLKEKANKLFLHSSDDLAQAREAVFSFVSHFLHETGNYRGFNYLTESDMQQSENGKSFGILPIEAPNRFEGTDPSRVFFH